jgi:SAM-dependent methyltransferase
VADEERVTAAVAEDRYERERAFHEDRYADDPRAVVDKYYRVARRSHARYVELLATEGAQVLEYGCGVRSEALEVAGVGSHVTGIDISAKAVELARQAAVDSGRDDATFVEMNAERLTFADDSFDLVCGSGILHHLALDAAYAEVARVLRPGGRAVFVEPLGLNPVINLYRRLTPNLRSEDEHPLRAADLRAAERWFGEVRVEHHHLTTLALAPFDVERGVGPRALRAAEALDSALLALPGVRQLAWIALVQFARPV